MAISRIRNISGGPLPLPSPYRGTLEHNSVAVVTDSVATATANLGGALAIQGIFQVETATSGDVATFHDGGSVGVIEELAKASTPVAFNGQQLKSIADGTAAQDAVTKAQLDASGVAEVPKTRTVTAGTGLTGGGDLSADRSFAVDTTTIETVADAQVRVRTTDLALVLDSTNGPVKTWSDWIAAAPKLYSGALSLTDALSGGTIVTAPNGRYVFPQPGEGAGCIVWSGKAVATVVSAGRTVLACGVGVDGDHSLVDNAVAPTTTQIHVTPGDGGKGPTGAIAEVIDSVTGIHYFRKIVRTVDQWDWSADPHGAIPNAPAVGSRVDIRTDVILDTTGGLTAHAAIGHTLVRKTGNAWRRYSVIENTVDGYVVNRGMTYVGVVKTAWRNGGAPTAGDTFDEVLPASTLRTDDVALAAGDSAIVWDMVLFAGAGVGGEVRRLRLSGVHYVPGCAFNPASGRITVEHGSLRTIDTTNQGEFESTPLSTQLPDQLSMTVITGDISVDAGGDLTGSIATNYASPSDLLVYGGGHATIIDGNARVANAYTVHNSGALYLGVSMPGSHCYASAATGTAVVCDGGTVVTNGVDVSNTASDAFLAENGGVVFASGVIGSVPGYVFQVKTGARLVDDGTNTATGTLGYCRVDYGNGYVEVLTAAQVAAKGGVVVATPLVSTVSAGLLDPRDQQGLAHRGAAYSPSAADYWDAAGSNAVAAAIGMAAGWPAGMMAFLLDFGSSALWNASATIRLLNTWNSDGASTRGLLAYGSGTLDSTAILRFGSGANPFPEAKTRILRTTDFGKRHLLVLCTRVAAPGIVDVYFDGDATGSTSANFASYVAMTNADAVTFFNNLAHAATSNGIGIVETLVTATGLYSGADMLAFYRSTMRINSIAAAASETFRLPVEGATPSTWVPTTGPTLTGHGAPYIEGGWT